MSYGLTPYDKKSYRESKRRRRQAMRADRTGRILPFSTARRRLILAVCTVLVLSGAIIGGYFAYNAIFAPSREKSVEQLEQEKSAELLQVVNRQNMLAPDYVPSLSSYGDFKVNSLALESMKLFADEAKNSDVELILTSAYISYDEQNAMYNKKLSEFLENPEYSEVRAQAAAQRLVPTSGCSEAQTGLLIGFDMSDEKISAFIERKCVDFGFIQRYPKDKEDITRMSENKTLYRYVGVDNARKMRSYNMCLEEYSEYIALQKNND